MGKLMKEFKEFVMRGNVMDLAVGVIIGGAFGSIVTSLCNDVILPGVGWLIGTVSGQNFTNEAGQPDFSKATEALNVGPIAFGNFVAAIINFLIMAIIIFAMVKAVNRVMNLAKKPEAPADPTTKKCPFCISEIDIKATRCPNCTSTLNDIAEEALEEKKPADSKKKK